MKSLPKERFDFGEISVLSGEYKGIEGPVKVKSDVNPTYLSVNLDGEFKLNVKDGYTVLAYVVEGKAKFTPNSPEINSGNLVVYEREGDEIVINGKAKLIILSGKPLNEPIAWYGPIVMNNEKQILEALVDLRRGTFIRHKQVNFEDY